MMKISCYQTNNILLAKTFCLLAEKCYYGDFRTLVVTGTKDLTMSLDKSLWTYSKKHFIPHATNYDPSAEDQAVLITDQYKNLNNANIIIFINVAEDILLNFFSGTTEPNTENYSRIMFLNDELAEFKLDAIKELVKKSPMQNFEVESFAQDPKGGWHKES